MLESLDNVFGTPTTDPKKKTPSNTSSAPVVNSSASRLSSLDNVFAASPKTETPAPAPVVETPKKKTAVGKLIAKVGNSIGNFFDTPENKTTAPELPNLKGLTPEQAKIKNDEYQAANAEYIRQNSFAKQLPSAIVESLPFGIGQIFKEIHGEEQAAITNPDSYETSGIKNVTGADVKKAIVPSVVETAKGFVKAPINGALNVLGIGGTKIKFNIPYLGEVSNANYKVAQRIANGEDPMKVTLEEGSSAILDTLFFADLAAKPFQARSRTVAELDAQQAASLGKPNRIGTGEVPARAVPKTGRLYEKPTITTKTFNEIPKPIMDKMVEQGVTLKKYDPTQPTYFKFEMSPKGEITGQVIQIKPSVFDTIRAKFGEKAPTTTDIVPVKSTEANRSSATDARTTEVANVSSAASKEAINAELSNLKPSDYTVLTERAATPEQIASAAKTPTEVIPAEQTLSATTDVSGLDKPSAEVQARIEQINKALAKKPNDPTLTNELVTLQNGLSSFQDALARTELSVVSEDGGDQVATVQTFQFSNGKYGVRVNADTGNHAISTSFATSKQYPTKAQAIEAGTKELTKWAKVERITAEGEDAAALDNIVEAVNTVTSNSEKKPENIKVEKENQPLVKSNEQVKKSVLPSKKSTQKEAVKETVKEEPKSIKQIAKETGIKEPNVRRILGVGAKEGTFERKAEGVYILNNGKEDIAFVHAGDAVETLPKLAEEGLKVDMVFLDIPYNTPAVKGGSRGVKYDLISPAQFKIIMQAVSKIVKTDDTPVYYMFSRAESGLKAMLKYNDVLAEEGFKAIAEGNWQKLFNNGQKVTNVRGEVARPEGIILLNKSGVFNEKDQERNLDFTTVRPRGYSTEKPAELLRSIILQGTKEGDTVIDPFAGSGVTGSEAIKAGRKAILIEKNPQVVEKIINPRVREAFIERDTLNTEAQPMQGEIGLGAEPDGNFLTTKELEANGEAVKILKEEVSRESKIFVEGQNKKPKTRNQSKGFASMDTFRETMEPIERAIDAVNPIDFPELVKLARELTGEFPKVKMPRFRPSLGGNPLGLFHPVGDGKITLNPDLFKEGNEQQAAKTLAHEIGHLIDYLPEHTMARGNILGRLAVMRNFRKDFLEAVGATRTNTEMQRELWALSKWWKPVDEETAPQSYLDYRKSAPEIYADFISVLFNDPKLAADMAPESYNVFFKTLDKKPEVKEAYFKLQDLLTGTTDELMSARQEDIRKGFARGEDLQAGFAAKKEAKQIKFWERLRQQVDDVNYPITKKQQQAEAAGHVFAPEDSPRFVLQEQSLADNENFLLVETIDREIVKPIEKAGMIVEDIGEYLLLDRIINERVNIANPFGFNTKNAPKQMEFLKKTVGEENFALLEKKVKQFHDLVYKSVEEAVAVGSYNKELFETKIKPNKDHYASFQVVDYMQDYMPATVKGQVGTLKEVANPFISTILKTVALNRLNAYQRAKNATIKMLKETAPDEISDTKRITSDGKLSIFKPARDRGGLEVLEDGKMTSYDVDPYIAESFKRDKVGDLNMLVSLLDKFNNKLFKPVVTTYNLGFALAFNPIRDIKRNYKLIPNANFIPIDITKSGIKINTAGNLLSAYVKSFPDAVKYAKGELTEFSRALVESKAINAPVNEYNYDARDDELGNILRKYGLITEEKALSNKTLDVVRKKLLKPVAQVLEGVRFIANTFEIVSKLAGARVRIAGGESGKQLAYNLRNFTGTPNYKVRGKQTATTNAIFVFSNIMKEGLKSDFKVATDPTTRSGYWWKTVKIDLLPKFLMFLAGAGVLGVGMKKYMEKISEYDKSNYIIIPMGTTDDGKAVYIRIPHDETGRLISAAFWKMANFAKDGKGTELQDVFALGAGQLPSVTPAITVLENWTQYLSGRNPYDAFHGRNLIDDTTWQAGGGAALKKMVQWTTNNLGFTKFATYDTSKNTGVETFMQTAPFFSSVIKISDYGQQEKLKAIGADVQKEKARQTLEEREVIAKYVKEAGDKLTLFTATTYGNKAVKEILGHMPQSKEEQDHAARIQQKFKLATKRQLNDDPRLATLIDAGSNDEKKAILKSIKEDSTPEEYAKIQNVLLQQKIVSPAVLYSVK